MAEVKQILFYLNHDIRYKARGTMFSDKAFNITTHLQLIRTKIVKSRQLQSESINCEHSSLKQNLRMLKIL